MQGKGDTKDSKRGTQGFSEFTLEWKIKGILPLGFHQNKLIC